MPSAAVFRYAILSSDGKSRLRVFGFSMASPSRDRLLYHFAVAVTVGTSSGGARMLSRRTFLGSAGAALLAPHIHAAEPTKKKLAVVTTVWTDRSHAWHMAERFLHGYPIEGKWHKPPIE